MPCFDYKCPVCKAVVEVFKSNFDDATKPAYCPYCGRGADGEVVMERQPAAPAFTISGYSAKNGYSSE
jgi:putative FmdB family regulatory protein